MGFVELLVLFAVVWWLVFFMALPFGVRPPEEPGRGHAPGAPDNPRLALKASITTAISGAITGAAFMAVEYDLIAFREIIAR